MGNDNISHCTCDYENEKNIFIIFSYLDTKATTYTLQTLPKHPKGFEVIQTFPYETHPTPTPTQDTPTYSVAVLRLLVDDKAPSNTFLIRLEDETKQTYRTKGIKDSTAKTFKPEDKAHTTFSRDRSSFIYQIKFETSPTCTFPPSLSLKRSDEFKYFLSVLKDNENIKRSLFIDSLNEIKRNTPSIEFLFVLEIFIEYHNTNDYIKDLLSTFDLKLQIEPTNHYEDNYLSVIQSTFDVFKKDTNYIKFILYFFYTYPKHFDVLFQLFENEPQFKKGILAAQIAINTTLFYKIHPKDFMRFLLYVNKSQFLIRFIHFFKRIEDFLSFITSYELKTKLTELIPEPPAQKMLINLNKKLLRPSDKIEFVLEHYALAKGDPLLTKHFQFEFDINKYYNFFVNKDLKKLIEIAVKCKQFNLQDEYTKSKVPLLRTFNYIFKEKKTFQSENITIEELLTYFEHDVDYMKKIFKTFATNKTLSTVIHSIFELVTTFTSFNSTILQLKKDNTVTAYVLKEMKETFFRLITTNTQYKEDDTFERAFTLFAENMKSHKKLIECPKDFDVLEQKGEDVVSGIYEMFIAKGKEYIKKEGMERMLKYLILNIKDTKQQQDETTTTSHSGVNESRVKKYIHYYTLIHDSHKDIFFKEISDLSFKQDDFFHEPPTFNFMLFEQLANAKAFASNKAGNYLYESKKEIEKVKNKLKKKEFKYDVILKLRELKDNHQRKINTIFFDVSEKENIKFCKELEEIVSKISKFQECIERRLKFENFFNPESVDTIKHLESLRTRINNEEICSLLKNVSDFDKEFRQLNESVLYNQYIESVFFKRIFEHYSYDEEVKEKESPRIKAKKTIDTLKNIISSNNISTLDPMILKIISKKKEGLDYVDIEKEVTTLKHIFGIDTGTPTNNSGDDSSSNYMVDIRASLIQSNAKKRSITEMLYTLLNINLVITNINARLFLLETLSLQNDNLYKELSSLLASIKNGTALNEPHKLYTRLTSLHVEIVSDSNYRKILGYVGCEPEFFEFFKSKTTDNVKELYQQIDDSGDETEKCIITSEDLTAVEKVVEFITSFIKQIKDEEDGNYMLTEFQRHCEECGIDKIDIHFNTVNRCFSELRDLFSEVVDKNEFTQEIIKNIYRNGTIEIKVSQVDDGSYISTVNYTTSDNQPKQSNFEDIVEIRDRARIKKKHKIDIKDIKPTTPDYDNIIAKANAHNEFIDIVNEFSDVITNFNKLIEYLNEFVIKGVPYTVNYTYTFNTKTLVKSPDEMTITFENEINALKQILEDFKHNTKEEFGKNEILTFLYGRHLKNLTELIKTEDKALQQYIKYLTGGKTSKKPKVKCDDDKNNKGNSLFTKVDKFIRGLYKENNISMNPIQIYESNTVKNNQLNSGLYTLLVSEKEFEQKVVECYLKETNHLPLPHVILQCSEETTPEEITAFYCRAVMCKSKILFCIFRIELLNIPAKQCFVDIFSNYSEHLRSINIKSVITIFYWDKSTDIIGQIEKIKERYKYDDKLPNGIEQQKTKAFKNIKVIGCDAAGVGKSYMIHKEAESNKYEYIYFPIGGEFTKNDIVRRLESTYEQIENKPQSNVLMHIDLSYTKKNHLLIELLFDLLVLGVCNTNEKIFWFDKDINIRIETPFNLVKYIDKYPILKLFTYQEIQKEKLPPLQVQLNTPLSNVQIVCNYLANISDASYINTHDILISTEQDAENNKGVPLKQFTSEECYAILLKHIDFKPTYFQINNFIKVLADQFKKFSNNIYLKVNMLEERGLTSIRHSIVSNFIKLTKYFTKGAYAELLNQQNVTLKFYTSSDEEKVLAEEADKLTTPSEGVSFKNIDPSLVFINEDEGSLSIISRTDNISQTEYKSLHQLFNSQNVSNPKPLIKYDQLKREEYLSEIKKVLDLKNKIKKDSKEGSAKLPTLDAITADYVFTSDNYVKMILILLNTRANIPVILMGETGCGKTKLIEVISKLKGCEMETLNIHAGITDQDIINFYNEKVINNNNNKQQSKGQKPKQKWVFLDEINTCNSLGLICEMMTKHTIQGVPISENVVFIGACNPYRKVSSKNQSESEIGLVKKKEQHVRNLVYTVNPLPHSLLNYVLNFGALAEEDEKKYIERIIEDVLNERNKSNKTLQQEILNKTKKAIFVSQKYIKESHDVSAVSLRDIRRFVVLFKWFYNYLSLKQQNKIVFVSTTIGKFAYETLNEKLITFISIMLTLYLCYYVRLPLKQNRKYLDEVYNNIFDGISFTKSVLREQLSLIENFDIPQGIAKNKALLENIFTLFVCVNTKIPVFICGKPGCSKSLSVNLLCSAMKGQHSKSDFLKNYPRLVINSYQGSATSTSKGVIKLFDKAKKVLSNRKQKGEIKDIISMIFFDEMGLAEISPHNPLKVIHSELEYDKGFLTEEEQLNKVAFVGISNWKLDASKMNRGIFLSIPEPDQDDLIETAITIADSYDKLGQAHKDIFSCIASTYYKYKEFLSKNHKDKQDFHGSRDFYHIVKQTARKLKDKREPSTREIISCVKEALEINFGGLKFSINEVQRIFKNEKADIDIIEDYNVLECIKTSLQDNESRYPLIISKSSLSPELVENILKSINKRYIFFTGSQFENDITGESYSANIINKIQSYMNEDIALILQNMESIYPSLYDLFNQNFLEIEKQKYARIALGFSNNILCKVNDKFKCIVLVDENDIEKQEAPFLNRFEKHIISFEYMIKSHKNIVTQLKKDNDSIFSYMIPRMEIDVPKMRICDSEELNGLIYKAIYNEKIEGQAIMTFIYKYVVRLLPQEVIGYLSQSKMKNQSIIKYLRDLYNKTHISNFTKALETTEKYRMIVYTFTSIVEQVQFDDNVKVELLGTEITPFEVSEMLISSIKSEEKFMREFISHYENDEKKLLIIHFRPCDCISLNHIRCSIENYLKLKPKEKDAKENKIIVFMIHLNRFLRNYKKTKEEEIRDTLENKNLISNINDDYHQLMIDDLNGKEIPSTIKFSNIETESNDKLIELINIKEAIINSFPNCFNYIDHSFLNSAPKDLQFTENIIESLIKNESLQNVFKSLVLKFSKEFSAFWKDFLKNISSYITPKSISLMSLFYEYLEVKISEILLKITVQSMKNDIFFPYFYGKLKDTDIPLEMSKSYYETLVYFLINIKTNINGNKVNCIYGLNIPLFTKIIEEVNIYIKEVKTEFSEKDEKLRKLSAEKDDNAIRDIQEEKQLIIDNVNQFISDNKLVKVLIDKDFFSSENNFEYLLEDFVKVFLTSNGFSGNDVQICEAFLKLIFMDSVSRIQDNVSKFAFIVLNSFVYKPTLIHFVNVFKSFSVFFNQDKNLYDLINFARIEDNDNIDEHIKEINQPFYNIFEKILKTILDSFNSIPKENLNLYLNEFTNTKQIFNNINDSLSLNSKEINKFNSFINAISLLTKTKNSSFEDMTTIYKMEKKEQEYDVDGKENELCENLKEQLKFLNEKCKGAKDFSKLMVAYLISKYKKSNKQQYQKVILDFLFETQKFVICSQPFLFHTCPPNVISPLLENELESKNKTQDEAIDDFLSFVNDNKYKDLLTKYNNNTIGQDVILYYFELVIYNKLYPRKNEPNICFLDVSFKYFEKAFVIIKKYHSNTLQNDYPLNNVAFFYSLAYIRVYLSLLSNEVLKNKGRIDITPIITLLNSQESTVYETVRIFMAKCIRKHFNSYGELTGLNWTEYNLAFMHDYAKVAGIPHVFNVALLDIQKMNVYNSIDRHFTGMLNNQQQQINEVQRLIKDNSFLHFHNLCVNRILSTIQKQEGYDGQTYQQLSTASNTLFSKLIQDNILTERSKKVLDLFYNREQFKNKILPIVKTMKVSEYETFIYYYKCAMLAVSTGKGKYYNNLLSENTKDTVKANHNPGANPIINPKTVGLETLREEFETGKDRKKGDGYWPYSPGLYVCDCGIAYSIENCSLPVYQSKCSNCNQDIGGQGHEFRDNRPGHVRVFQNMDEQNVILNFCRDRRWDLRGKHVQYNDYKARINQEIANEPKGIPKVKFGHFLDDMKVRNMDKLTYRLLNLIFNSTLYFANLANLISDQELKEFICEGHSCLELMKHDLKMINNSLKTKNIKSISIFLNIIIPKLLPIINNNSSFDTKEQRINFETQVDNLIKNELASYQNTLKQYQTQNNNILGLNSESFESIIDELNTPSEINATKYPLVKYFILTSYPNPDNIAETIFATNNKESIYPVLSAYFEKEGELSKIPQFFEMHPLVSEMISRFSYQLTREEGRNQIIKDVLENIDDQKINEMYQRFLKVYNPLMKDGRQFKCRPMMEPKNVNESSRLAFLLNDDGELNLGMHIAAIYQKFIEWENTFINAVIDRLTQENPLLYLKEQLEKKTFLFSATPNDLIDISKISLSELILYNSYRDCCNDNGQIDYSNYSNINIDIPSIEIEMGKQILTGKKQLEDKQNFIIYKFEAYRSDKSSIISDYLTKYPQRALTQDEKELLNELKENSENKNDVMFSLQQLIGFVSKQYFKSDLPVEETISKAPKYLNLNEQMKTFFIEHNNFGVNSLVEVYEYFEMICIDEILLNVDPMVAEDFGDEDKKKIEKELNTYQGDKITKPLLEQAVRRFISRMLGGKRSELDFSPDGNVFENFTRPELWPVEIRNQLDDVEEEINLLGYKFQLKFKNMVDFYYLVSGKKKPN